LKVLTEGTFDSDDANYNLTYLVNETETRMFGPLGPMAQVLAEKNLTYNHHHTGVTPDKYESDVGLKAMFKPTSLSYDNKGQVFVASMEAYNYPFYGVQFHPEK
jgi:gamma-glutamyl hydrolase